MVGRLDTRDCFFAVKKNVDQIKREDFKNPKKEDEYSTSVLGIQFTRGNNCTVQIISRYNHTVGNPNCTLGNDLDKLATGLEQSFANLLAKRGLTLNNSNKEDFSIPGYTIGNDGKYYKYNMEIHGDYYCPGNIIISNGDVKSVSNPEEGLLIDYFFLDKKNKKITVIGDIEDSFVDDLQDIEKIEVVKSKEENIDRIVKIYKKGTDIPVIIGIDRDNKIIKYENKNVTNIGDRFLFYNRGLTNLELPSLIQVGDNFLASNKELTYLNLSSLIQVGSYFLFSNRGLTHLELPSLTQVGDAFLNCNKDLSQLDLPNLIQAGKYFLNYNEGLNQLKLPSLTQVGDDFLYCNNCLTHLELPNLKQVGYNFLYSNKILTHLELPSLTQVGNNFLVFNRCLTYLEFPKLPPELREKFSYIIAENKKTINSKSIAQIDKDNELTVSEIGMARRTIEELSEKIDENKREME